MLENFVLMDSLPEILTIMNGQVECRAKPNLPLSRNQRIDHLSEIHFLVHQHIFFDAGILGAGAYSYWFQPITLLVDVSYQYRPATRAEMVVDALNFPEIVKPAEIHETQIAGSGLEFIFNNEAFVYLGPERIADIAYSITAFTDGCSFVPYSPKSFHSVGLHVFQAREGQVTHTFVRDFNGLDRFSGQYECSGRDLQEGKCSYSNPTCKTQINDHLASRMH